MTSQSATAAASAYIAYEYATVRTPHDLEPLYQDTFRSLGWTVESSEVGHDMRPMPLAPPTRGATSVLRLRRERGIRNRAMVQTLQRRAETSLASIAALERSKTTRAIALAVVVGIVGTGVLAGSVFALDAGLLAASIVLGTVGLIGWLGAWIGYLGVRRHRAEAVAPLIERELVMLHETGAQATRLLS